ncbi:MAG: AMIN domain-containing protein [Leptolyngbyaceae cyanobacterium HOT.MB2.61]|jgi:hypothetical protein|nr:AMIN domain-containing protein [Leptolyngbyaceae cyanobacterium HOT.MB2.61]
MAGFSGAVMVAMMLGAIASAQAASLTQWKYDPTANQLELTVKDGTTPRYFLMAQPARIVVDLPDTSVGEVATQKTYSGAVRSIRVSQFKPGLARIVIELSPDVSLAPGQVKLEKASGNSRWILQPLLAGATSKPPLTRTSSVSPPRNPSATVSSKTSSPIHAAESPVSPPLLPSSSPSAPPSPAASTVVPAIPLTNSTSTALFPPPSVNTNNAAIRRPSSVVKTPGSQTRTQVSQKPSPASQASTSRQPSANQAEDGFAANAAGIAIAVPPPASPSANSTTLLATDTSAPLDMPTTVVSVPPGSTPTITVPPLSPIEASPAGQTPFPPSDAPAVLPQSVQGVPLDPLSRPSSAPGVTSQRAIAVPSPDSLPPSSAVIISPPSATNDLPPSVVPLTPPTVGVPQLSPALPTVSNPLPSGAYPPVFNVPPLSTAPSSVINPAGPLPGMPSSSVFRQNSDSTSSPNSSGIANQPQVIEFGQPLPAGLTNR